MGKGLEELTRILSQQEGRREVLRVPKFELKGLSSAIVPRWLLQLGIISKRP